MLGLRDACKFVKKAVDCVHIDKVCIHLIAEHLDDLLGFPLSQKPVIDVHTDEIFADRLDEQRRNDGRIHPARKRKKNFLVADLFADRLDLLINEFSRQLRIVDARHVFGTLVAFHNRFLREKR